MLNNPQISNLILIIAALVMAVVFHEVAHGYAALRLGDDTARRAGRLTLNPIKHLDLFGSLILPVMLWLAGAPPLGYAKPVPVNFHRLRDSRKGTIIVSLAGVTANFVTMLAAGLLFQLFQSLVYFQPVWKNTFLSQIIRDLALFLLFSVKVNALLGVFNLIPIPPLDGSRVLMMLLPLSLRGKFVRLERYGMFILIILVATRSLNWIYRLVVDPLIKLSIG